MKWRGRRVVLCMSLLAWDLSFCGKMSSARPAPCVTMRGVISGVQSGQSQTMCVEKGDQGSKTLDWISGSRTSVCFLEDPCGVLHRQKGWLLACAVLLSPPTRVQWASQDRGVFLLCVCAVPKVLWFRLQILLLNKSTQATEPGLG